jgi:bifunctional non-homologous end joining protein LigD
MHQATLKMLELLRDRLGLDEDRLPVRLKTSGSKGFHVHVPVHGVDQQRATAVAQLLADELAQRHPDELTTEFRKADRRGRVLVDWWRNGGGSTAVAVWSPRIADGAPVAVPITRDEIDEIVPNQWRIADVQGRLDAAGDVWADPPRATDLTHLPDTPTED